MHGQSYVLAYKDNDEEWWNASSDQRMKSHGETEGKNEYVAWHADSAQVAFIRKCGQNLC